MAVEVLVTCRSMTGDRAFPVATACAWNSLLEQPICHAIFKDVLVCNVVLMALTSALLPVFLNLLKTCFFSVFFRFLPRDAL